MLYFSSETKVVSFLKEIMVRKIMKTTPNGKTLPCPFLKTEIKLLNLGKNAVVVFIHEFINQYVLYMKCLSTCPSFKKSHLL